MDIASVSADGSLYVQPQVPPVFTRSLLWAWLLADALMYLIVKSLGSNQRQTTGNIVCISFGP
ncbi:hypothetical protein Q6294_24620 [Klebsiella pneumoniae]|uniref:Uncharacterized protein n=1 Tax=Klebsiella pneumoniae TaxID=573 RepID=A0AAW8AL65_KLEPN|nr:hypothetical protein [Klebsiella pneumoniae]MDP0970202.1 hypothetical protein [Klebsiella pneumoniae]